MAMRKKSASRSTVRLIGSRGGRSTGAAPKATADWKKSPAGPGLRGITVS